MAPQGHQMIGAGWTQLTADQVVNEGESILWGLVLLTSVTGGDVTVYDGLDASSGRKIATVEGEANISNPIFFPRGLYIDRGIFVDVGSNVTEVLISWEALTPG